MHLANPRSGEDGTAIGDAIALAAARLEKAEEAMARQAPDRADNYEIKSKVMILLTDGQQTAGKRDPVEAAKLAEEWGIKIYTIAVGGDEAVVSQDTIFGRFLRGAHGAGRRHPDPARRSPTRPAGSSSRPAMPRRSTRIYHEIDELERSEIESLRFMDYKELFLPFAVAAFLLLVLEVALNCTLFRKIP